MLFSKTSTCFFVRPPKVSDTAYTSGAFSLTASNLVDGLAYDVLIKQGTWPWTWGTLDSFTATGNVQTWTDTNTPANTRLYRLRQ